MISALIEVIIVALVVAYIIGGKDGVKKILKK